MAVVVTEIMTLALTLLVATNWTYARSTSVRNVLGISNMEKDALRIVVLTAQLTLSVEYFVQANDQPTGTRTEGMPAHFDCRAFCMSAL